MKKYLSILIAMLAAMTLLTSCSDDDDKNTVEIAPIETGDIPAKNIRLFVDGRFFPISPDATTHIEGTFNTPVQYSGTLRFTSSAIFYTSQDSGGFLYSDSPQFEINLKKKDDKLTFSGEAHCGNYIFSLSGEIFASESEGNMWIIRLERTLKPSESYFCGKTFEIPFEKGSFFPGLNLNTEENLANLCNGFFEKLPEVYVGNSGYSAARIKFLDDYTYELWFREAQSGEYIRDESTHHYMASNRDPYKEVSNISFIDEPAFKQKQAGYFSLKPIDILAENKDTNFAQQTMVCDMTDSTPMCVTAFQTVLIDNGDERTLGLCWLPYKSDMANNGFMSQWTEPESISNQEEYDFATMQQAQKNHKLGFSARVYFTEVK